MAVAAAKKKVAKKKTVKKKKVAKKTTKKATKKKSAKKTASAKTSKKRGVPENYSLVIVESPSKAKTIKKYLGKNYVVVASNGHIKDLPKSKLGVDIKNGFHIDLVPITGKKKVIEKITDLAKKADKIYLAPDPDREGEAIAYHLKEEIGKRKTFHRVLFNAITKTSVLSAMEAPLELDTNKYDSQKTRRILDRLVGYKISPILWDKVQRGLSAGRVQSVALRIIVEREDEIRAFKPEQWFSIHAILMKDSKPFEIKYYGEQVNKKTELTDESFVKKILADTTNKNFEVVDVKKRERKQNPTPPFTTSKLQQEAANKLSFTAKKTMMVAQKLYEGITLKKHGTQGLITYMRTDSVRTTAEALEGVRQFIGNNFGSKYLPKTAVLYQPRKKSKSKVQDAHEAIRPANLELSPDVVKADLDIDEFKLYTLIWNKFVASQMNPAILDQTSVLFVNNGHFFKANGSIIKFTGFREVYLESIAEKKGSKGDNEDENDWQAQIKSGELPQIEAKEKYMAKEGPRSEEHWTSPPPRFNEASIVRELEEQGIGRPSTYASIISNILTRGYVEKMENRFLPTELGNVVCRMLIESFPNIMNIAFTANVELLLDDIEDGGIKWKKVLRDFWNPFEKTLEKAKEEMKNLKKQEIPTGMTCRKCDNGQYFIKWGRNGQFFACENYPECTGTEDFKKNLDGSFVIIEKQYGSDPCPDCGKRLQVKKGKFGRFLACEEYPNCKVTLPYTLDIACPRCKVGKFAEKKSRYGKLFYGCSSYPDCDHAMWTLPKPFPCKGCGHSVMGMRETKRDGKHLQCPECKYKVPIEETPYSAPEEEVIELPERATGEVIHPKEVQTS